jgi:hypothetical protein
MIFSSANFAILSFASFAVKIWIFTAEYAEIGKDAESAKGRIYFVSTAVPWIIGLLDYWIVANQRVI